jgi:hypothetical protein
MFPRSERTLTFWDIADYWSRESLASKSELLDLLVHAWWRGEFPNASHKQRLEVLKIMFNGRSETNALGNIVFTFEGEAEPERELDLADGSKEVDIRPYVPVPSRGVELWTEAKCEPAFRAFGSAGVSITEHYPHELPLFGWFFLSRDEFISWVQSHNYFVPTFWRATVRSKDASSRRAHAPTSLIQEVITRVYDDHERSGKRPPNVNEITKPVQERLREEGYESSLNGIRKLAGDEQFAKRRWKPGKTRR